VKHPEASVGEDLLAWVRFAHVFGIPARAQRALLAAFGSPADVLAAPASALARILGAPLASAWAKGPDAPSVDRALRWLEGRDRHYVCLGDPGYPGALLETSDPPVALFVQGRMDLLNVPAIAVVGSRNATTQGMRDAEEFSRALSDAGLAIVSGLALGIDAAAHRGGLAGRSSSLAVMGTGPERIYPARNRDLADRLATEGVVVTEFALGTPPREENFPRRNRIISGLSRGVLVVEAAPRSGSLITARLALEQGRDVLAIPGSIHSPLAKGCHDLIRQGAKLVESVEDVLAEVGTPGGEVSIPARRRHSVSVGDDPLLEALGFAPASIDEITARTGRSAAQVAARLAELEVEGRVASLAGGRFQRLATP